MSSRQYSQHLRSPRITARPCHLLHQLLLIFEYALETEPRQHHLWGCNNDCRFVPTNIIPRDVDNEALGGIKAESGRRRHRESFSTLNTTPVTSEGSASSLRQVSIVSLQQGHMRSFELEQTAICRTAALLSDTSSLHQASSALSKLTASCQFGSLRVRLAASHVAFR